MSSDDKQLYIIPVNNFHIVYSRSGGIKFEYLSYKQYRVINTIYQLVKLNVILKLYVSNRLKENVYIIKEDMFSVIAKAEKNKVNILELRIFNDTVYLNDIDASIFQIYIERFLQKIDFINQKSASE